MKELETLKAHQEAAMASKNAPKTSSLLERDSNSPAAASQAGVRRVSMEGPAASSGVKASNSETQKPETENIASGKENDAVFPVPMGPALRYASSSSALSDISLPFPKLHHSTTYGSVFGPHEAMFLPGPPPFHYAVSRGQELIGAPMIGTPQYAYVPYPVHPCYPYPVPVSLQRQETPTSPGSLSMAASALLDLTPATGGANPTGAVARFPFAERSPNFKRHAPMTVPDDDKDAPSPEKKTKEPAPAAEANLPNANIAARSQRLFENVPLTTTACKCKSSRCLKLYCACFQTGTFCDELVCKCKNCQNTEAESVPRGARTRAIYEILHRRPNAFDARLKKKTGQGCACKKSRYVSCYYPEVVQEGSAS
jgi:hypothetical protein